MNDKEPVNKKPLATAVAAAVDEGAAPATVLTKSPAFKTLDASNLYRVDVYTDSLVADIRVMTPVTVEGAPDSARASRYFSTVNANVNGVPHSIGFEITEANTLAIAIEKFPAAAEKAGQDFLKQLQEQRARRPIIMPNGSGLPS